MALKYLQIDDVTGKPKRVAALFKEDLFTGAAAQTTFTCSNGTLTASNLVDVFQNGVLLEETSDWTRNVSQNQVVLTQALQNGSTRIRVRVWS